jgi:hypothetical protein
MCFLWGVVAKPDFTRQSGRPLEEAGKERVKPRSAKVGLCRVDGIDGAWPLQRLAGDQNKYFCIFYLLIKLEFIFKFSIK